MKHKCSVYGREIRLWLQIMLNADSKHAQNARDFRLPPWSRWKLGSSGLLRTRCVITRDAQLSCTICAKFAYQNQIQYMPNLWVMLV